MCKQGDVALHNILNKRHVLAIYVINQSRSASLVRNQLGSSPNASFTGIVQWFSMRYEITSCTRGTLLFSFCRHVRSILRCSTKERFPTAEHGMHHFNFTAMQHRSLLKMVCGMLYFRKPGTQGCECILRYVQVSSHGSGPSPIRL